MVVNYEVGQVVKGKITGIQPYGAFVALDDNTQGLIHISEVAHGFIKDIASVIQVGQEVEVKILFIQDGGKKIGLSLKALMEEAQVETIKQTKKVQNNNPKPATSIHNEEALGFNTLKDKLQEWIDQSGIK